MFEAFRDVWNFLTNRQDHWSAKASAGGMVVFIVLLFELSTGVISNVINYQRISQLNSIEDALAKPNRDSATIAYLNAAKQDLIGRGVFPSIRFSWVWEYVKPIASMPATPEDIQVSKTLEQRNSLRTVSIYGFWLLVVLMVFIVFITELKFNFKSLVAISKILVEIFAIMFILIIVSNSSRQFSWRWELAINLTLQIVSLVWYFTRGDARKTSKKSEVNDEIATNSAD